MYPFKLVDISARNPLGKQIITQKRREVIISIGSRLCSIRRCPAPRRKGVRI